MVFWKKLLFTVLAMLAASVIAGLIWHSVFSTSLPSYIGGIVGGLTALPVWSLLGRIRPDDNK